MALKPAEIGANELRGVRAEARSLLLAVGLFTLFMNILTLTGPLYMLQVYDRVLGSRSEETLLALSLLMTFLFVVLGILDTTRSAILARYGARFQARLDERTFAAAMRRAALSDRPGDAQNALRDLEAIQKVFSSPVLTALFDLPFAPFFIFGIGLFHPWLGLMALGGAILLVLLAYINQRSTSALTAASTAASVESEVMTQHVFMEAEMIRALGITENAAVRWLAKRKRSLANSIRAADVTTRFSVLSKTFRLFLQSAMLGLGAYLVLNAGVTSGVMIASSVLFGRAMAPIDLVIGQWGLVQRAHRGWGNLSDLLGAVATEPPRTELPRPAARLVISQLTVVPPGQYQASLRSIAFEVNPGEAVGVIGPSGSGKSTLARAVTGVWKPAGGKIRLDGASLDQYDPAMLGRLIGYLPQRVQLFDGTIAENIAKLSTQPDSNRVVAAAQKAAAHDMILQLPEGYDTRVSTAGGRLSGGQIQRIGLARALYDDPVILVLDEPNSALDNEGSTALNIAIRNMKAEGRSVLIMAHRPAAIQECDTLLVLDGGMRRAFGPREQVLAETVANATDLKRPKGTGGLQ